jgi:hypothetical protein
LVAIQSRTGFFAHLRCRHRTLPTGKRRLGPDPKRIGQPWVVTTTPKDRGAAVRPRAPLAYIHCRVDANVASPDKLDSLVQMKDSIRCHDRHFLDQRLGKDLAVEGVGVMQRQVEDPVRMFLMKRQDSEV